MRSAFSMLLIGIIRGYQLLFSRFMPSRCRFYPSCSEYAIGALTRFGGIRGGWLGIRRLMRCHPWHPGGLDLVPDPPGRKSRA